MTPQGSAESPKQNPRYDLNIKILTPRKLRGLERSSASTFRLNITITEEKVGSTYHFFFTFKLH